jgi:phosphoribosyl-dephospho-CoA transferase
MRKAKAEREAAAKEAKVSTQVLARRRQREYDERQALKETASEAVSWTMDSDKPATSTPFAMLLKKDE